MKTKNPYKSKSYKHIDKKIAFEKVNSYIANPSKIATHSFLPFLHFSAISDKYSINGSNIENRPIKRKERSIYYSGHLDGFIYRYYSDMMNESYNNYAQAVDIDIHSVAYRTNRRHQSSINFAADVFAFLNDKPDAFVLIGDFTSFFDNLDHELLKRRMQKVLGCERLSKDWYNIFKSLTKFGYIERDELSNSTSSLVRNEKGSFSYFDTISDFRKYQKDHKIKFNQEKYGIPQGSAISGTLANVYSVDYDQAMSELAKQHDGLYKRYSDDFILILPGLDDTRSHKVQDKLVSLAMQNKIELQTDKTKLFFKKGNIIYKENKRDTTHIDFLGFTFDGKDVRMRERSVYKFYRNARKLITSSKHLQKKLKMKKLPNRHKIYSLYTDFGKSKIYPSNFISYAKRSQRIFDEVSPDTNNMMMEQLKNRKKIIEKALGYRIHSKI